MAAAGMLDKQIGLELGISLNTLRTYWSRIRSKLGDSPRAALVASFVTDQMKDNDGFGVGAVTHEGWILDVPSMTMLASDSVNDLHGLEQGVPHPVTEYTKLYHPEDRDATRAALYDVIEGRVATAHLIFRLALESGIELVHLTVSAVRGSRGEVRKVYGFRTRSLDCRMGHDHQVRVGHWERTLPDEFVVIDDELAGMIGRESGGLMALTEAFTFYLPGELEKVMGDLAKAIAEGRDTVVNDGRFIHTDGSLIWSRTIRRILRLQDGTIKVIGTVTAFK